MFRDHWLGIVALPPAPIRAGVAIPPRRARVRSWARVMGAAAAAFLAATACGPDPGASPRGSTAALASATPSNTVTHSSPQPNTTEYPNLSRFTDPFDRFAYKSGFSQCQLLGIDSIAEAFGGDPDEPPSVARSYAVAIFPQSVEHREATFRGCLDAFDSETE